MTKLSEILQNQEKTLYRRKQMASVLTQALKDAPEEMEILLSAISTTYYSGQINRFWDTLAVLAGAERGFGNDWFFTALELQKQLKGEKDE